MSSGVDGVPILARESYLLPTSSSEWIECSVIAMSGPIFGAQLYFLAQHSYLFFTIAEREARTRLETLAENTQLGAGFQVAIRDLEMRGSGDILSMRQSGHIASVGLHLYTEMLQQAVKDQQSTPASESAEVAPASARERIIIDLPLPAYCPRMIPRGRVSVSASAHSGGVSMRRDA